MVTIFEILNQRQVMRLTLELVLHSPKLDTTRINLHTFRQVMRLESTTRSPIYSHFLESIQGVSSICAYKVREEFTKDFEEKLNTHMLCNFNTISCNRWLHFWLDVLGCIIVLVATLLAIQARYSLGPAVVGLVITYALSVTDSLMWFVRMNAELENKSISIERLDEYCKLKSEAPWKLTQDNFYLDWPKSGRIDFNDYSTRYAEGLDLVLRGINLHVEANEKVGIVGRTGAGKSSITMALFRIIEPSDGTIVIDNVDITTIGLHCLRSKLTIIPQDPVVFTGTLRSNLDPANEYKEEEIWESLEKAHLKAFVKKLRKGLEHDLEEGGLLPTEVSHTIAREPDDKANSYEHVKELLLKRFKLTPEKFRQLFVTHQKASERTWIDFYHELNTYFNGWIDGLKIDTFNKLSDLIITDQLKRKTPFEFKEYYLDEWANMNSPVQLAEKLEEFEDFKRTLKQKSSSPFVKKQEFRFTEKNRRYESPGKFEYNKKDKKFPASTNYNKHYEAPVTKYESVQRYQDSAQKGGSTVSLLRENTSRRIMDPTKLSKNKMLLTGIGEAQVTTIGSFEHEFKIDDEHYSLTWHVVPTDKLKFEAVIGSDLLEQASISFTKEGVKFHKYENHAQLMQISAENLQEELDLRHVENRQIKKELEKLIQDYKPEKQHLLTSQ
ncbi:multidrug resistance-associated protein 1 [Trichonephila clavipes]|nr:multidrug resistance-associated protein 1 [Trichonephila clavipes]